MIKFIDLCEVWFLPESVASAICWRSPPPHASGIDSKTLDVFWGTADQADPNTLLLIWCGSWGVIWSIVEQPWTHEPLSVKRKIRRASRPGEGIQSGD
ncbi:hypothetical protein TNCV_3189151 [Trichonephila clavipes]|nr:hypothetical protein TNCV_3189151 [Trichonephila clavipes]